MIELVWDKPFLRILKKWKKKHPELMDVFEARLKEFATDPFRPSLRTHSLSGILKEYWAFSITYEYRLVFKFLPDNKSC